MGKNEFIGQPFDTMEQMWFWFMAANEAKNAGARYTSGQGAEPRPCEPADVLCVMDRLYRNRILSMDHLRVLKHYGTRRSAPDQNYRPEQRAYRLWNEALNKMRPICERKGIVVREDPMQWLKEKRDEALTRGLRVIQGGIQSRLQAQAVANSPVQLSMALQTV